MVLGPRKGRGSKELTLGQLIAEYLRNEEEYGQVVLQKYEDLLKYINRLRVLSAHPGEEEITQADAYRLIGAALCFLMDTCKLMIKESGG